MSQSPAIPKAPLKVLVVDDDRDFVKSFMDLLKNEGFEVFGEYNGKSAAELLREKSFDVAFVDALLPGMDGFRLCSEIRWNKHLERMPLVMFSGVYRSSTHAREAVAKHKLSDYLDKPISPETVVRTLRKILGKDYPKPEVVASEGGAEEVSSGIRSVFYVNTYYLHDPTRIPLVGNLKETPFPILLGQMHERSLSGQLMISWDRIKKIIVFDKGIPVAISSNVVGECLGPMLVRRELISKEMYQASLEIMKQNGRKQGETLLDMGVITSLQLSEALRQQFMEKLISTFAWFQASYAFKAATEPASATPIHDMTLFALLREGMEKGDLPLHVLETWTAPYLSSPLACSTSCEVRMQKAGFNLKDTRFALSFTGKEMLEEALNTDLKSRLEMLKFILTLVSIGALSLDLPTRLPTKEEAKDSAAIGQDAENDNTLAAQVRYYRERGEAAPVRKAAPASAGNRLELLQAAAHMTEPQKALYSKMFVLREDWLKKNYFEIFGGDKKLPVEEVKKRYLEMVKVHHPDAVPFREVPEIHKLADEIFTILSKAHETLTQAQKRNEYLEFLSTGGNTDATDEVARILAAEQNFHDGVAAIRRKEWPQAKKFLLEAIKLNSNEGEFYGELGWAHFNLSPHDLVTRQESLRYLEKAAEMAPKVANTHYYMGAIHKAAGDIVKAADCFVQTLQVDPKHARALSEVRLLKMRKEQTEKEKKGGIFSSLFKK